MGVDTKASRKCEQLDIAYKLSPRIILGRGAAGYRRISWSILCCIARTASADNVIPPTIIVVHEGQHDIICPATRCRAKYTKICAILHQRYDNAFFFLQNRTPEKRDIERDVPLRG
jgi:hypothetical protein